MGRISIKKIIVIPAQAGIQVSTQVAPFWILAGVYPAKAGAERLKKEVEKITTRTLYDANN